MYSYGSTTTRSHVIHNSNTTRMNSLTLETIVITVPIDESGWTFDELRERLSLTIKREVKRATLYDWIGRVCLLKEGGIYKASYTPDDLKILVQWASYLKVCKRGTASRRFQQVLLSQFAKEVAA